MTNNLILDKSFRYILNHYNILKKRLVIISFLFCAVVVAYGQTAMIESRSTPEAPNFVDKNIVTTNHIEIYPNPVEDYLTIFIENSTLENVELEMYNIIGNSVNIEYEKVNEHNYRIKVKEFNPGYYFVVVKDPSKRFNKSFKFQKK